MMSPWINIKEFQPPINKSVLITDGHVLAIGLFPRDHSYFSSNGDISTVTHWMSLPELPNNI